jgi:hypothetical protein
VTWGIFSLFIVLTLEIVRIVMRLRVFVVLMMRGWRFVDHDILILTEHEGLREAVRTLLVYKRPLSFRLGSHFVDLADEFLVRLKIPLHIFLRFLFKVI